MEKLNFSDVFIHIVLRFGVSKKIVSRVLFGLKYYVTMNAVKCLRLLLKIYRVLRQYSFTQGNLLAAWACSDSHWRPIFSKHLDAKYREKNFSSHLVYFKRIVDFSSTCFRAAINKLFSSFLSQPIKELESNSLPGDKGFEKVKMITTTQV